MAWLIAKLYAFRPIEHSPGRRSPASSGAPGPARTQSDQRFEQRFDRMLTLPLAEIEPALQWAIDLIASKRLKLDWVRLTNDLSIWERESTRLKWAEEFLNY